MAAICWMATEYESERLLHVDIHVQPQQHLARLAAFMRFQSMRPARRGSRPIRMFSATVRFGQRLIS